ncbi:hypothetical protein FB472_1787 [Rhodoglobus vestalii]|uniref:Uncharacterized protein n=1 Tax=Rhodoglobus vestalii TaxID=193384 RepID=A0A8H2K7A0_9MICO|nr:hypothetical protein FB472_1787 [Rhodoglobus vestalii]
MIRLGFPCGLRTQKYYEAIHCAFMFTLADAAASVHYLHACAHTKGIMRRFPSPRQFAFERGIGAAPCVKPDAFLADHGQKTIVHPDVSRVQSIDLDDASAAVKAVKGLGLFGTEFVLIRGANAPDELPHHEHP